MAKRYAFGLVLAGLLPLGVPALAQKPANAPANATAQCGDGTFSTAKTERGACSKHGGVKTWFGAASAPAKQPAAKKEKKEKAPAKTTAPSAAPTPVPTPAPTPRSVPPPPPPQRTTPAAPVQKAPPSSGKAATVAPPAGTPDNATAKCKDGTYSFAKTHSGACSRHGGVAEWYK